MVPTPTSTIRIDADRPMSAPVKTYNKDQITAKAPNILATIRCLVADLVQQFNGGHPGTPMGAAAIGLALWGEIMRFNPSNAGWINRDRFILSNGHACLLQYIFLHLCGYPTWTLDMVKRYHSPDFLHSQSAGHPEIEFEGIELTTGPLGQGIANAVGLAMASKHLGARYNRKDHSIIDNKVWVMSGDGCIQEGVGQEAISIAGHLQLDNLILIYDNNRVTVDGNIDTCFTEDTNAKMLAMGWEVIEVKGDATNDVVAIMDSLTKARNNQSGKPVFVNIVTMIGHGSAKQGLCPTHGAALGEEDVKKVKSFHGKDPNKKFDIPQDVYTAFKDVRSKGNTLESDWNDRFQSYKADYPDLAKEFEDQVLSGHLNSDVASILPSRKELPTTAIPTRKASGLAMERLGSKLPQIMAGSADLAASTFVHWPKMTDFQHPSTNHGTFEGRQIRYGIREHAMAAIANGLAAYSNGAIIPVISTFFMFFLYAAPAIRMAALQKLRLIGIATHDSIGIGEDGPTHQPIALASLFRAMPNLNFIRPADAEEVQGAWKVALSRDKGASRPTILSLSRQGVPLLDGSSRDKVALGAYQVWNHEAPSPSTSSSNLVLVSTGSEVSLAIQVAQKLAQEGSRNVFSSIRVVSMPCQALFDEQSIEYRRSVLPPTSLIVAIEAWSSYGWARYAHASINMHSFGLSGPQAHLYQHFGFGVDNITRKIVDYARSRMSREGQLEIPGVGDFQELLLDHLG